jgi:hypothetical protein
MTASTATSNYNSFRTAVTLWYSGLAPRRSVRVVTRLWAGQSGVRIPAGAVFPEKSRAALGYSVFMVGCFPAGIPTDVCGCHSSPSSDEIKNERSYTATPRVFSWCIKGQIHRRLGRRCCLCLQEHYPKTSVK